ncbi:RNA-directed DNA polymerase, eukaryota, reverse transcriptase zinc-binding domain protein [Tanacetum coccineum]
MPPRVMTQSASRPATTPQGRGTGGRAGRGGGRNGGQSGDQGDGRNEGQGGQVGGQGDQVDGQGSEVNDGVNGVPDFSTIIVQQLQNLLPTIVAQVGDQGRGQGNGRNQNGDAVNDNIRGDVSMGCTYKEFLACNPIEYDDSILLVKLKDIDSMSNMYTICRNEGFSDLNIHHVGGLISKNVQVEINNELFEATVQEIGSWCIKITDDYIDLSSNDNIKDVDTSSEFIDDHSVDDLEYIQTNLNNIVSKLALWNRLQDFMHHHNGSYIMFGDMNAVRNEQERVGSIFNNIEADYFKYFIDATEDVIDLLPDIRIISLDRIWSDHNPILLYVDKIDFGPSPFKLYNSWLLRDSFDDLIKSEWDSLDSNNSRFPIKCHEKFCILKAKIRQWNNNKTM